jgi:hypothetical protein
LFLHVDSASYAAKAWVDGAVVTQHLDGHLPLEVDVTPHLAWDGLNIIAIAVENKQLLGHMPPARRP